MNPGRWCYHQYQHRLPRFTQSECNSSLHQGGWRIAGESGRTVPQQAGRKQALELARQRYISTKAKRRHRRLRGSMFPQAHTCLP